MMYDSKIKDLVKNISFECNDYLLFVESLNENASTDRIIERIIDKSHDLEFYHNSRFEKIDTTKSFDTSIKLESSIKLEYELLNYWNDQDDLYVNYIVRDVDNNLQANVINYYNTSDVSENYNILTNEETEKILLELIKKENINVFELPKVSELSPLLKYIYNSVCESDSNMCHIDEEDWKELCDENNYTNEDVEKLKEEIEKYNLQDYITIDSDSYKICGYGCLQCCFNDDTIERTDELER